MVHICTYDDLYNLPGMEKRPINLPVNVRLVCPQCEATFTPPKHGHALEGEVGYGIVSCPFCGHEDFINER